MNSSTAQKILKDVKSSYSAIAADFDVTRNFIWPGFEKFLEYVKPGDKVLDLGCGNGRLLKLFASVPVDYIGIDNNEKLIELAKKNYPDDKFLIGDILALPFPEKVRSLVELQTMAEPIEKLKGRDVRVWDVEPPEAPGLIDPNES